MKFKGIDPTLRIVLLAIAGDSPLPEVSAAKVTVTLIEWAANSAHKQNSSALAALALAYLRVWDSNSLAAIDSRKSRLLSMTSPAPEPEIKHSCRVSYDEISWAIQAIQPDPVDLLTRPRSCPHAEIHPADMTPIVRSSADDYDLRAVHSIYHPNL